MNTHSFIKHLFAIALVIGSSVALASASAANLPGNADISRVWSRLDGPVEAGSTTRTWFWGPAPITDLYAEQYQDAPGGQRLVIYFDKTRMEINENAAPGSTWRVTNGLLATELITGRVQLGDDTFMDASAPEINVAGDPDDAYGPTYRSLSTLLDNAAISEGELITQTISRDGGVGNDQMYGNYGVTGGRYIQETGHTVASVFWNFITSEGMISVDGNLMTGPLFENHVYGVGYPITEAYWTTVRVAGTQKAVLIQAFQRRVMTYTPDNPDGWKVEAGNVGMHYRDWRALLGGVTTPVDSVPPSGQSEQSDDCNGESVNMSDNGTSKQSNSATINQSGGDNNKVVCSQKNVNVQKN